MRRLRQWLLIIIAGKMAVAINLDLSPQTGINTKGRPALIHHCTFMGFVTTIQVGETL